MRKLWGATFLIALFGAALIAGFAGGSIHRTPSSVASRGILTAASSTPDSPQLTGVQLFYRARPVEQLVIGRKIKKYSVELTGTGFVSGSRVAVELLRVFPHGLDPQQPLVTTDAGAASLKAAFHRGMTLSPGLLAIKVVNPDGAESNALQIDVISNPSDLSITSISPDSGPIGTQVTLTGVGFLQSNPIRFSAAGSDKFDLVGFYQGSSSDGRTIAFSVPVSEIAPICVGPPACDPYASLMITPAVYRVSVVNSNGLSNSLLFRVTSR